MTAETAVKQLRKICLALPKVEETSNHGHPTFKVSKKAFCVLHGWPGDERIAVKVSKEMQAVFLKNPRFCPTPHVAHHGYISLVIHAAKVNWHEVRELIIGSYNLSVAPSRRIAG